MDNEYLIAVTGSIVIPEHIFYNKWLVLLLYDGEIKVTFGFPLFYKRTLLKKRKHHHIWPKVHTLQ